MKKILVIDDNAPLREFVKSALEANGYKVALAEDGMDGVDLFLEDKFDLVITDIYMPNRDGISTIQAIRNYSDSTKIIAMSGGSPAHRPADLKLAKMFGAADVMNKPFTLYTLCRKVSKLIGGGRLAF